MTNAEFLNLAKDETTDEFTPHSVNTQNVCQKNRQKQLNVIKMVIES